MSITFYAPYPAQNEDVNSEFRIPNSAFVIKFDFFEDSEKSVRRDNPVCGLSLRTRIKRKKRCGQASDLRAS